MGDVLGVALLLLGDAVEGTIVGLPGNGVGLIEGEDVGGNVYAGVGTINAFPVTTIVPPHTPLPPQPSCRLSVWHPSDVAVYVICEQKPHPAEPAAGPLSLKAT